MTKEKSKKSTKKKKKDVEEPVVQAPPVSVPEVVVRENPKTSLLPKTIAKPIEELSKRVKVLEELVAKLLGN
jgi:hypothetical protein